VSYGDFHHGYKQMVRQKHELLRAIRLPRRPDPAAWTHFYKKVGTRKYQSISKVCFAGVARWDAEAAVPRDVRIGMGSVAATVLRATKTESTIEGNRLGPALLEAAGAAMEADVTPIDDIRSTAHYRQKVSGNVAKAFVRAIQAQHSADG
jgi:xanthine dehydrogenase small subunit